MPLNRRERPESCGIIRRDHQRTPFAASAWRSRLRGPGPETGSGFRVSGLGFRVSGLGFRV